MVVAVRVVDVVGRWWPEAVQRRHGSEIVLIQQSRFREFPTSRTFPNDK